MKDNYAPLPPGGPYDEPQLTFPHTLRRPLLHTYVAGTTHVAGIVQLELQLHIGDRVISSAIPLTCTTRTPL